MSALHAKTLDKLSKLIPRLASDQAGEVTATVAAIMRTLNGQGADLHDLVGLLMRKPVERIVYREREVEGEPADTDLDLIADEALRLCEELLASDSLTEKQRSFVSYVSRRAAEGSASFKLSVKQQIWFRELVERKR